MQSESSQHPRILTAFISKHLDILEHSKGPEQIKEPSDELLDDAAFHARHIADHFLKSLTDIKDNIQQVEISFGIKLDADCNCALIGKVGGDTDIDIKLTLKP